jgi:hypothetical protein
VAVVRQARGEGRTIVESVGLAALREPELFMECIDLLPVREYLLFLRWELDLLSNYTKAAIFKVMHIFEVNQIFEKARLAATLMHLPFAKFDFM